MPYQFVPGARCAISKQTTRADQGTYAVVKSVDKEEEGNQATLAFFADEIGAMAYTAAIRADDAAALATLEDSIVRELPGVAKGSMPSLTASWRALFEAPQIEDEDEERPEGDDLVGQTITVAALPIVADNGAIHGVHNGGVTVTSASASQVTVKFMQGITPRQVTIEASVLRDLITTVHDDEPPTAPEHFKVLPELITRPVYDMIRALPVSRTLPLGFLSGIEMRDMASGRKAAPRLKTIILRAAIWRALVGTLDFRAAN